MDFVLKKVSELDPVLQMADADLLLIVDESDKSASSLGTTKKGTFELLKNAILDEVPDPTPPYVLPKATPSSIGGVSIGAGLAVDAGGTLSSLFTGSYNDLTDKPAVPSVLGDLGGVSVIQPAQGQVLKFFQGAWVNQSVLFEDIQNVPNNFVLKDSSASLSELVISGNLQVVGTTISNNFTTLNVGTNEIILNDNVGKFVGSATSGSSIITFTESLFGVSIDAGVSVFSSDAGLSLPAGAKVLQILGNNQLLLTTPVVGSGSESDVVFLIEVTPATSASITVNRSALNNASIRWNEQTDRWQFTNDGSIFYTIPVPSEYSDYNSLINKPSVPQSIRDLIDVSDALPSAETHILRWNGNQYSPSAIQSSDLSSISINALSDVNTSNPAVVGQVLKWNGSAWAPATDLIGSLTTEQGAIVTAPSSSSIIPFFHSTFDQFPNPVTYKGAVAYAESGGKLYYAHSNQWLELALASNVQPNTDTTYSLSFQDVPNLTNRKYLRLTPSSGTIQNLEIVGAGGVTLSKPNVSTLEVTSKTYELKAVDGTGPTDSKLRLLDSGSGSSDITFQGADGLIVERLNDSTLVFRAPAIGVTQYTDALAKTAAATALINGTHIGIEFTYDSVNQKISSVVTGGGGEGGSVVLYDLGVSNTTTNQAIVSLSPSSGTPDTFEIVGVGGTQVAWNSVEKKISVTSVAPVNADWNSTSGLSQILNKPTIPPAYTLPIAGASVLGGIKVGENLLIAPDGTLSAVAGGYQLPIASATVLGGIKIGSGLSISGDGVVTVAAGDGGTPLQTRNTISSTTSLLQPDAVQEVTIVAHKTYALLSSSASSDAWIRVYVNQSSMIADRNRSEGNDPGAGSGVVAEVRGSGTQLFTPAPVGYNADSPVSSNMYVSIKNRGASATVITAQFTILRLEA